MCRYYYVSVVVAAAAHYHYIVVKNVMLDLPKKNGQMHFFASKLYLLYIRLVTKLMAKIIKKIPVEIQIDPLFPCHRSHNFYVHNTHSKLLYPTDV